MTRLTIFFISTTIALALFSAAMVAALFDEAERSSIYSQECYKIGLIDGEAYTKDAFARALAERELIEESEKHVAEERL